MLEQLKKQFDKVKLQHFNTPFFKRNGKTIAVLFDGNIRHVGISECSKKDVYSKKKGRIRALGRAYGQSQVKYPIVNSSEFSFSFSVDQNIPQNVIDTVPDYLYTVTTGATND